MNADRKTERRRRSVGEVIPTASPVSRSPHTMMVLLVHTTPKPEARTMLWTQWPVSPSLGGRAGHRLRRRKAVCGVPRSCHRLQWRKRLLRKCPQSFSALDGSETIVCRTSPAAPASHFSAPLPNVLCVCLRAIMKRPEPAVPRHFKCTVITFKVAVMHLVEKIPQRQFAPVADQQAFKTGVGCRRFERLDLHVKQEMHRV